MTMTTPAKSSIPLGHPAWRLLHSHYHDMLADRPDLQDLLDGQVGRSFGGFGDAILSRLLVVRFFMHDGDRLSFTITRRVGDRTVPLGPSIPAAVLHLDEDLAATLASQADERWPDDLSGLDQ
jgi:hypothetical protein